MSQHLNEFCRIAKFKFEILNDDKALLLLNSLPYSYEQLTTNLLHRRSLIIFENVSNALMNNEYRNFDRRVH